MSAALRLFFWNYLATLKESPVKMAMCVLSVSIGVAMGFAIHLIHEAALQSFTAGVRQFSGTADRVIRGEATGFDDRLFDVILQVKEVKHASPVVELQVVIDGATASVKWIGLDFMRASLITPGLIGQADEASAFNANDYFDSHAVFLSPALLKEINLRVGDMLNSLSGDERVSWRIAGTLPMVGMDQKIIVSDIAAAQWRFNLQKKIHRIDIKTHENVALVQLDQSLQQQLSSNTFLDKPEEVGSRGAAVSRAYRVNLTILALVALLTGGFLIFSTQALSVVQKRRQYALLRCLGAKPSTLFAQILGEAALTGALGSLSGLAIGGGLAFLILQRIGGDLGGGYFQNHGHTLEINGTSVLSFGALGMLTCLLGAWIPAKEASQTAPASALKSGSEELALGKLKASVFGWVCLALSPLLCLMPAVAGLPLGGYAAIALGLIGGIAVIPRGIHTLTRNTGNPKKLADLSRLRMAHAPGQSGIALAGIVASFSLVVAMAVMVQSFRGSLDTWLDSVLPAPLYMKVKAGDSVSIGADLQKQMQALKSVEKLEFWSSAPVVITSNRAAPILIARPLNKDKVADRLPLISAAEEKTPANMIPVWVSEAMVDIYAWRQGSSQQINSEGFENQTLFVAGIWRDYARQQGAIVMSSDDYQRYTGKSGSTEAAFWPAQGYEIATVMSDIREVIKTNAWANRTEFSQPNEIRKISLEIFDRSFAVTYLLEATAIVIGLFGVAATFAATAISRRREFASLMALGAQRRDVIALLLREGVWVSGFGAGVGLLLGVFFSLVLIKVVNPQSFHWSMDVYFPYGVIASLVTGLMLSSTLTAAFTAWLSLRQTPVSILKEDWA